MNTRPWLRKSFVVFEALLFLAIPVLAYAGFRTLLDTRTGTFIDDPGPDSPGWVALVDPSPVVGVVEMDEGRVTGLAVIVKIGQTARGGAVILVPAELSITEGQTLGALTPEMAVDALANELQLRIPTVEVVDAARWSLLLGDSAYLLENPDPVPSADGDVLYAVGPVEITGGGTAAFLGRTVDGQDSLASLVRRELFWSKLLDQPPVDVDDPLSRSIGSVAAGPHEVIRLPVERGESGAPITSRDRTDQLVKRVVAFPAGDRENRRFRVRIEDRTGEADLDGVARTLGGLGVEVVAISNGDVFDDAPTGLRVVPGFDQSERLSEGFPGVPIEVSSVPTSSDAVVLHLGPDHEAVLAGWSK